MTERRYRNNIDMRIYKRSVSDENERHRLCSVLRQYNTDSRETRTLKSIDADEYLLGLSFTDAAADRPPRQIRP